MTRRLTTEEFVNKSIKVHGDKYGYSKVNYSNGRVKVTIICPDHGEFEQTPENHQQGKGCDSCADIIRISKRSSSKDQFVTKSIKIHGERYDYSKVVYKNNHTKVVMICAIHDEFKQTPLAHLAGQGCPTCGVVKCSNSNRKDPHLFIKKANKIHGGKYNYSKVKYSNSQTKVTIICPDHGEFEQTPNNHTHIKMKQGCPNCSNRVSKAEQEIIDFISANYDGEILTSTSPVFMNSRKELDIYIPKLKLAIEYNGNYYHDNKPKGYHRGKTLVCANAGVNLIHIWESDYLKDKDNILKFIGNLL